jgi:hypothetical protein
MVVTLNVLFTRQVLAKHPLVFVLARGLQELPKKYDHGTHKERGGMKFLAAPVGLAGFASLPKTERSINISSNRGVGESETQAVT